MMNQGTETAERLALTLAASLLLHFALIFGLQIRAVSAPAHAARVIQARLVEAQEALAAPILEPDTLAVQAQAPLPLAEPEPAAPEPPAAATPASAAAPESSARLPSIEVPLIEDPTYYSAKEVDVHPAALQAIQPRYPDEAASANVTGSVVLVLLLDEGGRVKDISVEEAEPPGYFEASALKAFRHARFAPAQRGGKVVKSRMRIKVNYELEPEQEKVR